MINGDGATEQVQGGSSKTEFHSQFNPGPSVSDMHEDSPPPTLSIQSGHVIHLPKRFRDYLLFRDMLLDHIPLHAQASTPPESDDCTATPAAKESIDIDTHPHPFQTVANKLGAFRQYTHRPTWLPSDTERLSLVYNTKSWDTPHPSINSNVVHEISSTRLDPYAPFSSFAVATYMHAYFDGGIRNPKLTQHPLPLRCKTVDSIPGTWSDSMLMLRTSNSTSTSSTGPIHSASRMDGRKRSSTYNSQ